MNPDDLGERAFLQSIRHLVHRVPGGILGFDDDASDMPITDTTHVVVNVDTFVRNSDWLPGMTPAQAGRKTAVMTISDILAKGAIPKAMMLSLSIPDNYSREDAREIVRGFSQYGLKNDISFIGGDLGSACDVVLTGISIGVALSQGIIPRGGTKSGDLIVVAGHFGYTTLAYRHLLHSFHIPPNIEVNALAAAYNPHIPHNLISALVQEDAISASMDCSDGLGITLHTMSRLSRLAFEIQHLPLSAELKTFVSEQSLNALDLVMLGGEEFIPVITIPEDKIDTAYGIAKSQKISLIVIGRAKHGSGVMYNSPEGPVDVPASGFDSLKGWD